MKKLTLFSFRCRSNKSGRFAKRGRCSAFKRGKVRKRFKKSGQYLLFKS